MSMLKIGGSGDASMTFEERAKDIDRQKNDEDKLSAKEKKSPFSYGCGFKQLNITYGAYNRKVLLEMPLAAWILDLFEDKMDSLNAIICSYDTLAKISGRSRPSIGRAIKYLKDNGYIAVKKSGTTHIYIINDYIAWKSYGKLQDFCDFKKYCNPKSVAKMSTAETQEPRSQRRNGVLDLVKPTTDIK